MLVELIKYSWWGESNEPPPHLKTKKQLSELGLAPLKAVGVIETRKYDLLLYDPGSYDAEIIEIAIINPLGEVLLDALVKPSNYIPAEATEIHGITDTMVADAPSFPEVYPRIVEALKDKRVLIYHAEFDIKILNYCCKLHGLPILKLKKRSDCLMEWAAQWGGDWSNYYKDYRYFPLNSGHRALGDCGAALQLIKKMAMDSDRIDCPVPIPQKNS